MFADPEEARRFLAENPDIRLIDLFLIDINGVPRGKLLHREELMAVYEHGRALPSSILGLDISGTDVDETGLVWDVADADCLARPLAGSLRREPWRARPTAQVQIAMDPEKGMPATLADPRAALVRVLEQLAADNLFPAVAIELEFCLLANERGADGSPLPAAFPDGRRPDSPQVYGVAELEAMEAFLNDLHDGAEALGLPLRTAISEYGAGQMELTLEHRADALQACDEAVRYKRMVKGVARRHGMQACFMAKPWGERAGNGMHVHMSLAGPDGRNLFASDDPEGTPLLRRAIGGMMANLEDSIAVFCPHANSYKRLRANSYAPLALNWGVNNRTVTFRVPGGPARSRHVEHRLGGADANPYLAAALVLAAAHDGIRKDADPGPAVTGNGYEQDHPRLTAAWRAALDRFAGSSFAKGALGEAFHRIFLAIKENEYARYMGEVGEQDWRWYLDHA